MKKSVAEQKAYLKHHRILQCGLYGDTILIKPSGTLVGMDSKTFHAEMGRVKQFIEAAGIKNAIFDLSQANYFGSEMIGGLFTIGKLINKNGKAVIAEPSHDMRIVLEKMKVNLVLPIADDTSQAIKELSNETILDRIKRNPARVATSGVFVVILTLLFLAVSTDLLNPFIGSSDSRLLTRTVNYFREAIQISTGKNANKEWENFSRDAQRDLLVVVDRFRELEEKTEAQEKVFQATFAVWQMCVRDTPPIAEQFRETHAQLVAAKSYLEEMQNVRIEIPELPQGLKSHHTVTASQVRDPEQQIR